RFSGDHRAPLLSEAQFAILLATLAINVLVTRYEQRRGRQLGSQLLIADAAHTRTDVLITIGVVIGMLFGRRGWWWVDPVLTFVSPVLPPLRRPPPSPRQEYQEFLLERIEEYKNTVSREELLRIGDEAVRELEANAQDQYLLTEVLLLEHVDRLIARRLRLPSFQRW